MISVCLLAGHSVSDGADLRLSMLRGPTSLQKAVLILPQTAITVGVCTFCLSAAGEVRHRGPPGAISQASYKSPTSHWPLGPALDHCGRPSIRIRGHASVALRRNLAKATLSYLHEQSR